ncbi:MAG: HAD-IC family P-type ATPase [Solirubrobacterales bacterium]|nr:HAD-IC family P-type ATPase [Solirubrobacterales bacterium]
MPTMASHALAPNRDWAPHALPATVLVGRLQSSPQGLSDTEARARLAPPESGERGRLAIALAELAEALLEPLQLLLLVVGVLAAIFGELRDAIAIFSVITIVAAVEAISEARAERALRALRELSAPTARVRRGGVVRAVARREVVVGDVLELGSGDLIAADCRVLAAAGLRVGEAALTGEPTGAAKDPEPVPVDAPLADRSSMVYAGTAVLAGAGTGLAVAVGAESELGRLGRLVAEAKEPPTPLQRTMRELARTSLVVALLACVLVPVLGALRGQPFRQMLLDGLTLAFATIPEELPILVTVLVAVQGIRLARRGVLLRKLRAAEAVGAATVLLSDKTGTLTENRLRLIHVEGERTHVLAAAVAALGGAGTQDPLDRALLPPGGGTVPHGVARRFPFDPRRGRESAAWTDGEGTYVAVKGAPERVLAECAIASAERERVLEHASELAREGLRVIAVACRTMGAIPRSWQDAERDLSLVGLAAFADPLRAGVRDAVSTLARAGVRTILITGDHPATATSIARQAGLVAGPALQGGDALGALSDGELSAHLSSETVIARASPADKQRLVRVLQGAGEVVAVTGDGVNDAPALAAADVGIAMGARGTDLAREAADLVLTDDAYPTIVTAIAGGRGLATQLRRAVAFYLGAKVALVATIAVPLALGLPSPFGPAEIVLLELFMDIGASVAFTSEPVDAETMRNPPRDPARRFLDRAEISAIALTAASLVAATLPAYLLVRPLEGAAAGGATALVAWLLSNSAIAWSLRTHPGQNMARNVAFPAWALAAALTAMIFALTPAAAALGLKQLHAPALALAVAAAAAGTALAAVGRRALSLSHRL